MHFDPTDPKATAAVIDELMRLGMTPERFSRLHPRGDLARLAGFRRYCTDLPKSPSRFQPGEGNATAAARLAVCLDRVRETGDFETAIRTAVDAFPSSGSNHSAASAVNLPSDVPPDAVPNVDDASADQREDGSPSALQGFGLLPEARKAVELRAMALASAYWNELGWTVEDVAGHESFDLRCRKDGEEEIHVEVKGTTGSGEMVILTHNEVEHARTFQRVALVVVSAISVVESGGVVGGLGGEVRVLAPWRIDEGTLKPVAFRYTLPE